MQQEADASSSDGRRLENVGWYEANWAPMAGQIIYNGLALVEMQLWDQDALVPV